MNQIKFRAWRHDLQKMQQDVRMVHLTQSTGAEVTQYTTRNDATGAELYDGDIINFKLRTKSGVFEYVGKIIWDEYMWLVETPDGEQYSLNRVHGIQLIGNIFETPEEFK